MDSTPLMPPLLPQAPFTFSILMTSPVRSNLPFSPVSAVIFPLSNIDARIGGILIGVLNLFTSFLIKLSVVHPPAKDRPCPPNGSVTLTMTQMSQLMKAVVLGQLPLPPLSEDSGNSDNDSSDNPPPAPSSELGSQEGPVGGDQPLFPDNLSVSLSISSAFAPFDGSPDTSFNTPLFEIPGVPGNLLIIFILLVAQFMVEQTGIRIPNHQTPLPEKGKQ